MGNGEMKVLIFNLNEVKYAIDIGEVERILSYMDATPMPDTPNFVRGAINYEDAVLSIIDIAKKFNIATNYKRDEAKIIVLRNEGKRFGVIVSCVNEVKDIQADTIEKTPLIATDSSSNYVKGLIKLDGGIVVLLNSDNIISNNEEDIIFGR